MPCITSRSTLRPTRTVPRTPLQRLLSTGTSASATSWWGTSGRAGRPCGRASTALPEIVAGAIKDYGRGIVIGDEQSHGKGTVQRVLPLDPPGKPPQLGALKLTTQKFYRINGHSTQLRGIRSDIVLPSITNFVSNFCARPFLSSFKKHMF